MLGHNIIKAQTVAKRIFRKYHGHEVDLNMDHYQNSQKRVDQIRGTYKKTKVPCSWFCCGNPRKWTGKQTLQETKSDMSFAEQLMEI